MRTALLAREIDATGSRKLSFGRPLEIAGIEDTYGALAPDAAVIALLAESGDRARPVLVFAPAG